GALGAAPARPGRSAAPGTPFEVLAPGSGASPESPVRTRTAPLGRRVPTANARAAAPVRDRCRRSASAERRAPRSDRDGLHLLDRLADRGRLLGGERGLDELAAERLQLLDDLLAGGRLGHEEQYRRTRRQLPADLTDEVVVDGGVGGGLADGRGHQRREEQQADQRAGGAARGGAADLADADPALAVLRDGRVLEADR